MKDKDQKNLWEAYGNLKPINEQEDEDREPFFGRKGWPRHREPMFGSEEEEPLPNEHEDIMKEILDTLHSIEDSDGYSEDDENEALGLVAAGLSDREKGKLLAIAQKWPKDSPAYPLLLRMVEYSR